MIERVERLHDTSGRPCQALPRQSLTRQAGFREIKQEIGSAETQTHNPDAVTNHLNFCLAATTLTCIYGTHLEKAPLRCFAMAKRTEYAFGDLRRALAKDIGAQGFGIDCQNDDKATQNPLIAAMMDLVA